MKIIIPTSINPKPEKFEYEAAGIVADFFGKDAEFIVRKTCRTPDIVIDGVEWEIKSPLGKSKHTIEEQLKRASRQSLNIVIDARRCKLHIARIRNQVRQQSNLRPKIKRVLLINKTGTVEIIKGELK